MSTIKNYLSLVKFSHTIFAMPFAMIGFFLGLNFFFHPLNLSDFPLHDTYFYSNPDGTGSSYYNLVKIFFLIIACMITARSAAMAFNRYLDRNFDARNPRTAIREIPRGIISANNALIFTITSCILFVVACFFINKICFFLSPLALFVILFYSYTKRFTSLCHL